MTLGLTDEQKRYLTDEDRRQLAMLAIGRIFRLGSRPEQPGDVEEYERCRAIILDVSEPTTDHAPNWVRDRLKGAQGD